MNTGPLLVVGIVIILLQWEKSIVGLNKYSSYGKSSIKTWFFQELNPQNESAPRVPLYNSTAIRALVDNEKRIATLIPIIADIMIVESDQNLIIRKDRDPELDHFSYSPCCDGYFYHLCNLYHKWHNSNNLRYSAEKSASAL